MPTIAEILAAFSGFVADNIVLVAGSVIVGLAVWGLSRLIRSGR